MSEATDTPIVNDAITADDAGFSSDVGEMSVEESSETVEAAEESSEDTEGSSETVEASSETSEEGVKAENVDELKDEIEEAIEDGASEQDVKDMIREYTLKVNGKEKKVKIDLSNEEDLVRRLQLAEASQVAMQERRELEKTYEDEVRNLLENPFEVLEELGLDPLKLAEERIRSEVEERKKSPELREKERIERELAKAREELKRQQQEAESARMAQLEAEAAAELDEEISAALDAHPSLPRTEGTIARIAETMMWTYDNAESLGINPDEVKVKDVIPTVEKEIREEIRALMSQLPDDGVEELLGQQFFDKLRKKRLSAAKTVPENKIKPTTKSVTKEEREDAKKKIKAKDYFSKL